MTASIIENGKRLESIIDFSKFTGEIFKHWWKVALIVCVITGISFPFIQGMVSQYVSTATVLIKAQSDNATPMEQVDGYDSTRNPYYETQYTLMQSRVIIEKAVRTLKLDEDPDFNGEAGRKLVEDTPLFDGSTRHQDNNINENTSLSQNGILSKQERINNAVKTVYQHITISGVRLTQLVYVSFEWPSSEVAAKVANGVAQSYIDYSVEQKVQKTIAAQEWNQQRLAELKQTMLEQKKGIEALLDAEGLLTFRGVDGFETETLGIVTNKLADAKDRRLTLKANYDVVSQSSGIPLLDVITLPEISSHAQVQDLRIALISANKDLYQLQKRYGPKHQKVLQAKAKIEAIQVQTRMLLRELEKGLYKSYQAALQKERQYELELAKQKQTFQAMAVKRDKYNTLKTDLDKTTDLYKELYQRTQELSLNREYREPDSVLYDPAVAPEKPSKPNKALFLIMIFMLTLILCVVALIVKAALQNSITTMSDIKRRLGLLPLGELGVIPNQAEEWHLSTFETPQVDDLLVGLRTKWILEESNQIQQGIIAEPHRVISIMSATAMEGRSLVSYLIAKTFAHDSRTLLIDMDYRSENGLTERFNFQGHPGFSDSLNNIEELESFILPVEGKVDLMPKGTSDSSSLLLLSNLNIPMLLEHLKARYDRIIIDLPCVESFKDGLLVSKQTETTLWVVESNKLNANQVLEQLKRVSEQGINVMGAMVNQVKLEHMQSEEAKTLRDNNAQVLIRKGR